ncbi:fatty-acid amide hydrolase 2-B-like [Condylostylus longicornis]|uniref:fatty-acid amide hydrolase 2-B-like n=1 Tax=Condylostylus longicornis TaxID=2530218 RepID=UPI00244E3821|nr:fatty-acid amide hydrolase 2-B-like [Condylostylus longicornis]XP_055381047.1 fatty-acid amide hydrolase 2-B-like [Condylostylus longicornis]
MEIIMRFLASLLNIFGFFVYSIIYVITKFRKRKIVPPITNKLLLMPAIELAEKIRKQEIKSESVVRAYIERIQEVDPYLNAVIENRFSEAIKDAQRADELCTKLSQQEIATKYPLLGIPFTVKESVGLKGCSHVVGNVHRKGYRAIKDGAVVENLKQAGCIPLLVSNNPEFCFSWETDNIINGTCHNPYDTRRSPGGSSGGEAALIGAGASLFGIGSDVAGSIRVPGLFTGIFGHKPTGGFLSTDGHFPRPECDNVRIFLQVGPMARYAKDLPILMQIMAGENAYKLNLERPIATKDIKVFYLEDLPFSFSRIPTSSNIQLSIMRAVNYLKKVGLKTEKANIPEFYRIEEISFANVADVTNVPSILVNPKDPENSDNLFLEIMKHVIAKPKYSFAALGFDFLVLSNHNFIPKRNFPKWAKKRDELKASLIKMLGEDGVLILPTYNKQAIIQKTSLVNITGFVFVVAWNVLGFPATHVTMGLDDKGIPVGFQVVAAPYMDKLCLQIATELEAAFGGWVPPKSNMLDESKEVLIKS